MDDNTKAKKKLVLAAQTLKHLTVKTGVATGTFIWIHSPPKPPPSEA